MSRREDPRLFEARQMPVQQVVDILGIEGLNRQSGELIGPCPRCGGRDRFGINLSSMLFTCRQCGIRGNDQISLVREVLQVGFLEALGVLCGDRPAEVDEIEARRRKRLLEEKARRDADYAARAREKALRDARKIWRSSSSGDASEVIRKYLEIRGITEAMLPGIPEAIRFHPKHKYLKFIDGQFRCPHIGPAMVAAIQGPNGVGPAVHRTWIDLTQPNGKASRCWDGQDLKSKLVRGSMKGAAIRLFTPTAPDTLIVGEGIETTLTAMVARPFDNAAFWAGVSLGNMAGRMLKQPGKRWSGIPDMDDDKAFVPPEWCRRLVFIMDGDSDPKMTRAKLKCGIRRAMNLRPGLEGWIVPAGEGRDLNDILTTKRAEPAVGAEEVQSERRN